MCRSKADGGARCAGTGRSGGGPGVAPAAEGSGTPDRARTDELAQQLPADRTGWDGKPLDNDADRRMFALRESGYRGPIDQDGYPATEGRGPDILRHMAEQRGETVDW